jgi:1-acyl-sn-glycerol-3-phosphate acyltransferase
MLLTLHLLHGVATATFLLPRLTPEQRERRIQQWCRRILVILNIRVATSGHLPDAQTVRTLFVSNHISWIDIWALKQLHPMRFVAKSEILGWPIIGWLAEKSGTLFIARHKRHEVGRTMNSVEQALSQDDCLCFFPEGTTTDGTELKPFKSSLFQAAINANALIWPLAIHYPGASGGTNTEVAYCGDITMQQSLWAVLRQKEIVVELRFAAPLPAAGQERRNLSHHARQAIASRLPLARHTAPETSAGLPDAQR